MNNLGQYLPGNSLLHRLDPRSKIIVILLLSVVILRVSLTGVIIAGLGLAAIWLITGIPIRRIGYTIGPMWPFFALLMVMYLFFTPGIPVPPFPLGPVKITYAGIKMGIEMVAKFLFLIIAGNILTMTTSPTELTMGLQRLLRPLRLVGISSSNLAMMVALALRFIPSLLQEMDIIREAQLARGANYNPRRLTGKMKSMIHITIPLLISSFRHSDELVDAMQARGYQSGPRTYLTELKIARLDYVIIAVTMVALFICW